MLSSSLDPEASSWPVGCIATGDPSGCRTRTMFSGVRQRDHLLVFCVVDLDRPRRSPSSSASRSYYSMLWHRGRAGAECRSRADRIGAAPRLPRCPGRSSRDRRAYPESCRWSCCQLEHQGPDPRVPRTRCTGNRPRTCARGDRGRQRFSEDGSADAVAAAGSREVVHGCAIRRIAGYSRRQQPGCGARAGRVAVVTAELRHGGPDRCPRSSSSTS